jgi:hypothetical protein
MKSSLFGFAMDFVRFKFGESLWKTEVQHYEKKAIDEFHEKSTRVPRMIKYFFFLYLSWNFFP